MRIREFLPDDVPRVAEVHRQAFQIAPAMTPLLMDEYARWLHTVFLQAPTRTPGRESLVCEDGDEIIGFFGVVARTVELNGTQYDASTGSNLAVLPERRGGVGTQIIREYLLRSSELAIVDEVQDRPLSLFSRAGMVAMPQSVRWTLPLSPLRHLISLIGDRVPGAAAAGRLAGVFDGGMRRVPGSPFRYGSSGLVGEQLSDDGLVRLLGEFGSPDDLRPVTSDGSTAWLLKRARSMHQHGELQLVSLREPDRGVVGWYIYYARRGAAGEVLQLVASTAWANAVLEHLAGHAIARGVISLSGVMDLRFLSTLSRHWGMISPSPRPTKYLLVSSTSREILEAFWRNRVLLSRLDGEWCHHLR